MSTIRERMIAIIVEHLDVEIERVVDTASFEGDLGADSLDTVELVMEFEEKLGIHIPDEEADKVKTVGEAVALVEKITSEKEKSSS